MSIPCVYGKRLKLSWLIRHGDATFWVTMETISEVNEVRETEPECNEEVQEPAEVEIKPDTEADAELESLRDLSIRAHREFKETIYDFLLEKVRECLEDKSFQIDLNRAFEKTNNFPTYKYIQKCYPGILDSVRELMERENELVIKNAGICDWYILPTTTSI